MELESRCETIEAPPYIGPVADSLHAYADSLNALILQVGSLVRSLDATVAEQAVALEQ